MPRSVLRLFPAVSLALALAVACTGPEPIPEPETEPARVVVFAPSGAEILAELGLSQQIVGVGDFVDWPPEMRSLPQVGSFLSPNVEAVLALEADLVITTRGETPVPQLDRLEQLGVGRMELPTDTYEGLLESILRVGERLGRAERAKALAGKMRSQMEDIAERVEGVGRPRVVFVVGRDPLYVAGPGSHIDQMIATAGGTNIFGDALSPYQLVSVEAMLERLPEVILEASDNRPGAPRGRLAGTWGAWSFLPAVENERVFWLDPGRLSTAGPRLPENTELLGRLIHPEIFGEPTERDFLGLEAIYEPKEANP